ncbi:VanZ family protein [Anaerosporobacter faecicola]|uniref:VanZ family protein n=1 Tax=Anaerosporobacter faecicola TaxID=2718714 RepID=UPI002FE6EB7B
MESLYKRTTDVLRVVLWIFFIIYLVILTYFLFFSEQFGRVMGGEYRYNLQLFREIKRFIIYRREVGLKSFFINIVGNIVAFIPFGFILPAISPKNRKFLNVALLSFEFTLSIELLQLVLQVGTFDVDDIFLNLMGGIIGYLLFAIGHHILRRFRRKSV